MSNVLGNLHAYVLENSMRKDLFCSHPQMVDGCLLGASCTWQSIRHHAVIAGIGGSLLMVDRKRGERDRKRRGKGRGRRRGEEEEEKEGRKGGERWEASPGSRNSCPGSAPSSTILYLLPFPEPLQTAPSMVRHSTQEPVRRMLHIQGVTLRKIVGSGLPESF